jgi:ribosomal protein S21
LKSGTASAVKTHSMGVRIEVGEGQPLGKVLREFKRMLEREGFRYQWYKHQYRLKPCEERRRERGNKKLHARRAALLKRLELGQEPILKK